MTIETSNPLVDRVEAREPIQELVNVGEPPITGRKEKGKEARKEKCEDVKINDPEKGLFMVADGVSMAAGWFASRETGQTVQDILGQSLDEQLEHIAGSDRIPPQRKSALMSQLVRMEIRRTVLEADQRIKRKTELDPRFAGGVATTLTLARLVEFPDGTQHAFITNVGDSRLFVLRGGKLFRLTKDDGWLSEGLKRGMVTQEEVELVDQADGIDALPDHLRLFYQRRNIVTRAVGAIKSEEDEVEVKDYQLFPGDRLVLASDGLTDQMQEHRILTVLQAQPEDRATERVLQQTADQIALEAKEPRAKADDISVVVRTIGEHGPDRSYLHPQENQVEAGPAIAKEHVDLWRTQIPKTERALQLARQGRDENEIRRLEIELAQLEYWVARMDLKEIQESTPARFERGDKVRVGNDRIPWEIRDYSQERDHYIVSHPSAHKHQIIDRFDLELWQTGDLARPNDKINMVTTDGKSRGLYTLVGEGARGFTVLIRELPEGIERRMEDPAVVEAALRAQLQRAHLAKKQMNRAEKFVLDNES